MCTLVYSCGWVRANALDSMPRLWCARCERSSASGVACEPNTMKGRSLKGWMTLKKRLFFLVCLEVCYMKECLQLRGRSQASLVMAL
jgi:hypothetical protein